MECKLTDGVDVNEDNGVHIGLTLTLTLIGLGLTLNQA